MWNKSKVNRYPEELADESLDYKYNEDRTLLEIKEYIDKTYEQHYSKNKFQATEFILDSGHGEGFCIGNILKYTKQVI